MYPKRPEEITNKDVDSVLRKRFTPKKNFVAERYNFGEFNKQQKRRYQILQQ